MTSQKKPRGKGKPFTKNDPRINRTGVRHVDSFAAVRKELQRMLNEVLTDDQGQAVIDKQTGEPVTRLQARIRLAISSRSAQEFQTVLRYAYGEPTQEIDLTTKGIMINVVRSESAQPPALPAAPAADSASDSAGTDAVQAPEDNAAHSHS